MYEASNPGASIAIINGESVTLGSKVGPYSVAKIDSTSVTLRDESTGAERPLFPKEKQRAETAKAGEGSPSSGNKSGPEAAQAKTWKDYLTEAWEAPGKMLNRFWELMALRHLAILNNACVNYFDKQKRFPTDLKALVDANLIAQSYEKGVAGKYNFYFMAAVDPRNFGIRADPLDPESGLHYFFVGTDAIIRESLGSPANQASKPHAY